jgi:hypothetical protein
MANFKNDTRYRAASLGALLGRHYPAATPHRIASIVCAMQQAAKRAKSWELRRCNYGMDEKTEERGYARLEKLQASLNASLCDESIMVRREGYHGPATVSLGGDPRGPGARLSIPGQAGDGWGEGFAIY